MCQGLELIPETMDVRPGGSSVGARGAAPGRNLSWGRVRSNSQGLAKPLPSLRLEEGVEGWVSREEAKQEEQSHYITSY